MFQSHPRNFESNLYIYPVLSRRAGGISIGLNLNPDKFCNFDCPYCQVDRAQRGGRVTVHGDCPDFRGNDAKMGLSPSASERLRGRAVGREDLPRLAAELDEMLDAVTSGRLFAEPKFSGTPEPLRRLNDLALSGDGEPTSCPVFGEVVELCAEARRRRGLDELKLILITNATLLHREPVRRALEVLDANNGEIWAKLDSGTEAYYHEVARSRVPFQQVLDNLLATARARPIVVQTLFMRLRGESPPMAQQEAYCDRLCELVGGGGRIKLVQIHTVARQPAENWVTALSNDEVDAIVALVRGRTGLPVAGFYGCPT